MTGVNGTGAGGWRCRRPRGGVEEPSPGSGEAATPGSDEASSPCSSMVKLGAEVGEGRGSGPYAPPGARSCSENKRMSPSAERNGSWSKRNL